MRSALLPPLLLLLATAVPARQPNVVLMMTDDQGYGDFGVLGNELIETPHIDKLAAASGSMTTFYVSPVCSPTRASLMTGRYNHRTRCIDTWIGRSMMDTDEWTIAEALRDAGYATGCFGKWHLGDCYPMRPQDQGFDESLIHRGGGLAQPSEPLENGRRYTDPILFRNGQAEQTKGYCTDVYFDAGLDFIERQHGAGKPFFIYLPTNAPHGPYHDVPPDLLEKYMAKDLSPLMVNRPGDPKRLAQEQEKLARIAAMITNEDENVGRLMQKLGKLGIAADTIVIRINDNGPNTMRYAGPFRGMKSHVHEGGVRSPCWVHWPAKIEAGSKSDRISAHIDILPTLIEACSGTPGPHPMDGRSFLGELTGDAPTDDAEPRSIVIQSHRGDAPVPYHHFMIRHGNWKLLHASGFGNESFEGDPKFELYDLAADPGETRNLAAEKPEMVEKLKARYDTWFKDVGRTRPDNYASPRIVVGTEHENPTVLTWQDRRSGFWRNPSNGHWLLRSEREAKVEVRAIFHPDAISAKGGKGTVRIGDEVRQVVVPAKAKQFVIENVPVAKGEFTLEAFRDDEDGDAVGAYHVEVRFP